jgi:hypothetical protein
MKKLVAYLLIASFIIGILAISSCANIIPPTGGPRDSLPPVLVHANPPDSTMNFPGGKIVLTFNEYVDLNNYQENMIVSPVPKIDPIPDAHLRTITIRLKDTLEPNTTYSINFGRAIKDINEGNELKDFTYIFTTGNYFDSLEFSGRVLVAETGRPDSTLIVVLHRNFDDSAVAKENPRYFTRLDSSGHFTFRNLPSDTFRVYAMKAEGGMKRYTSPQQLFAFADSPVVINASTRAVVLFAYAEPTEAKETPSTPAVPTRPGGVVRGGPQDKVLRIQTNLEGGQLDLLSQLEIQFSGPIKTMDTTQVRLTNEVYEPVSNVRYLLDSTRRKLTVQSNWLPNRGFNLIVSKEFVEDSAGKKIIRDDTLSFKTKNTTEYGSLKLRFINLDLAKHPVLQFVQGGQLKYAHIFTDRNVNIRLFQPGEYELRILYDDNQNGKWDPGEFFEKHRQPEKVQPLQRKLEVKPNWDSEVDITL